MQGMHGQTFTLYCLRKYTYSVSSPSLEKHIACRLLVPSLPVALAHYNHLTPPHWGVNRPSHTEREALCQAGGSRQFILPQQHFSVLQQAGQTSMCSAKEKTLRRKCFPQLLGVLFPTLRPTKRQMAAKSHDSSTAGCHW